MVRLVVSLLMLVIWGLPLSAYAHQKLAIDLASDLVEITTGFDGANIVLFGTKNEKGSVAITVTGPSKNMTVRKKNSFAGIWINSESMNFLEVPGYYNVSLEGDFESDDDKNILKKNGITTSGLKIEPSNVKAKDKRIPVFRAALIRNKQEQGLYPKQPNDIQFIHDNFFKTEIYIPSNVPVGDYKVQAFIVDGEKIKETSALTLRVVQVGLSATLYQFAYDYGFFYGLICVCIAVFSGWIINTMRSKA